jgi:hypothetical protein
MWSRGTACAELVSEDGAFHKGGHMGARLYSLQTCDQHQSVPVRFGRFQLCEGNAPKSSQFLNPFPAGDQSQMHDELNRLGTPGKLEG